MSKVLRGFVLVSLSALLFVSGLLWYVLASPVPQLVLAPPDLDALKKLQDREAEDTEQLQVYQSLIERLLNEERRVNLTHDRAVELALARKWLDKYIERYSMDDRLDVQGRVAMAHRQLSLVHLLVRDLISSEAAARESIRLCQSGFDVDPSAETLLLRCCNEETLSWILARTGRLEQAEQTCRSAVAGWSTLADRSPTHPSFLTELSIVRRNLAILLEALGRDGLPEAAASIQAAETALTLSGFDQVRYATLIDSEQIYGLILWQHGRVDEAKSICRSSLQHLREVTDAIRSTYDSAQNYSETSRYEEARLLVLANLALASRENEASSLADVPVPPLAFASDNWSWKPLNGLRGHLLGTDLLIRGNRFHGEFEPQDALLLSWHEEWNRDVLTEIIAATHQSLPVVLAVQDSRQQRDAERTLREAGIAPERIQMSQTSADTSWVRDYGPFCVRSVSGMPLWIDPVYVYPKGLMRFDDDEFPDSLARSLEVLSIDSHELLEGGALLTNGRGLCLVTTDLRDRNKEFGISESKLTKAIQQLLGARQVVYLEPLHEDPTAHLDWFCTFTSADTLVIGAYGDEDPVNRDLLNRHADELSKLDSPAGPLKVVRIPMPPRGTGYFGGSYTNVIFANGVLVVPTWPEASAELEQQVFDLYRELLPDWEIVPVSARRLGVHGGGPRCVSRNLLLRRIPPEQLLSPDSGT